MANSPQRVPAPGFSVPATPDSVASLDTPSIPAIAPDYEWIYPNSEDGKYFTATQAQIYIGNLFIDELVSLQFAFQGNHVPIYGYSSEEADAFGSGRRLVQGQMALNFVTEGYLYTVLSEYRKLFEPSSTAGLPSTQIANLVAQSKQAGNTPDQQAALSSQIQKLAAQGGPDAIVQAKAALIQKSSKNAITLKIPFDIHCVLQGAGRIVEKVLTNCVLTSNEMQLSPDGSVLVDVYGFMARSAN